MQPPEPHPQSPSQPYPQSYPQPPTVRRKYARRRIRDRKAVRRAQISARGLLTGGAVLVLLGGSQAGIAALGGISGHHDNSSISPGGSITGGSPGLGPVSPPKSSLGPTQSPSAGGPSGGGSAVQGNSSIPATVMAAYLNAQRRLAASDPGCHLPWQLLAAIGQVESGQAEGGAVTADGTARRPILGPVLNGDGFAAVRGSGGSWARAEGPMQFIPSTWASWGVDGNGDGRADPENVYDAALAAGDYLCSGSRDLDRPADLDRAILGYNDSQAYLSSVLAWMRYYQKNGNGTVPNAGVAVVGGAGAGSKSGAGSGPSPWLAKGSASNSSSAAPASSSGSATASGGSSGSASGGSSGASTSTGGSSTGGSSTSGSASSSGSTGSGTPTGGTPTTGTSPSPSSDATPTPPPSSGSPSPSTGCTSTSGGPTATPSPSADASPSPTPTPTATADPSASTSTSATPSPSPTCS